MNQAFFSVLEQMGIFLLLIGAGAAGALLKVLNRNSLAALSSFAMNFSLPCLVFSSTAGSMGKEQLLASWPLILVSLFINVLAFAFGVLSAKMCRLSGDRRRIHVCQSVFGNWGMIGIPLISALFGPNGMLPLTVFLICDQLMFWTLGVRLTYPEESAASGFSFKRLFNPVLLSAILGICFALFGIRLPEPLAGTVEGLGATTKYLSLIFVGGSLVLSAKESAVKSFAPFCVVLFKMLACPAIVFFFLRLTGLFDGLTATVFAVIAGLPSMCTLPMIAKANGSDDAYASTIALITTVCGVVTLPFLLWALEKLPF